MHEDHSVVVDQSFGFDGTMTIEVWMKNFLLVYLGGAILDYLNDTDEPHAMLHLSILRKKNGAKARRLY